MNPIRMCLFVIACVWLAGGAAIADDDALAPLRRVAAEADGGDRAVQCLVLATPHLASVKTEFGRSSLDGLLEVLAAFSPDRVGVEAIPGGALADMEAHPAYESVIRQFGGRRVQLGKAARETLGITRDEAEASSELDGKASPEKRIDQVLRLVAAYEWESAVLQWSLLSAEQRSGAAMPDAIRKALDGDIASLNETISVGVAVARRCGLDRVHGIDDHRDKDLYMEWMPALVMELRDHAAMAGLRNHPFFQDSARRLREAAASDLLPYYLYMNSPEYQKPDLETQWGLFFETNLKSGLDRSRYALWEVRNLNIASRIRRLTADPSVRRVLVVIGAGHKPFLDSLLSGMVGIEVVQLADLARDKAK